MDFAIITVTFIDSYCTSVSDIIKATKTKSIKKLNKTFTLFSSFNNRELMLMTICACNEY